MQERTRPSTLRTVRTPPMTNRMSRLPIIALSLIACGRSGLGFEHSSEAGLVDGTTDAKLGNIEPCPPTARQVPQCKDALVCEYNYGGISPLCAGAQICLADGGWLDTRNGHPCPNQGTSCPAAPPIGACDSYFPIICSYPDAGQDCVCGASCGPGKQVPTWRCFNPSQTCLKRPELGSACDEPGLRCEYPPGCCGAWVQTCSRGVWMQEQTQGCPP
jgi:hypothetical protein